MYSRYVFDLDDGCRLRNKIVRHVRPKRTIHVMNFDRDKYNIRFRLYQCVDEANLSKNIESNLSKNIESIREGAYDTMM